MVRLGIEQFIFNFKIKQTKNQIGASHLRLLFINGRLNLFVWIRI